MRDPTIEAAAHAPDLFEPVVGYRQWRIQDGGLVSPFVGERWHAGVNAARCARDAAHEERAPAHDCTCGIYAWYRPPPRLASALTADLVSGAVVLWGRLELHPAGMRAQYAMVVALALPMSRGAKRRRVVEIADRLEVDCVPARALQAVASQHGAPVAASLVPPRYAARGPALPSP
jgi:hypothetical protein